VSEDEEPVSCALWGRRPQRLWQRHSDPYDFKHKWHKNTQVWFISNGSLYQVLLCWVLPANQALEAP